MSEDCNYPRYMPAPPMPATTRPTIIAFIVGAAPHMALPVSKSIMLEITNDLSSKRP